MIIFHGYSHLPKNLLNVSIMGRLLQVSGLGVPILFHIVLGEKVLRLVGWTPRMGRG